MHVPEPCCLCMGIPSMQHARAPPSWLDIHTVHQHGMLAVCTTVRPSSCLPEDSCGLHALPNTADHRATALRSCYIDCDHLWKGNTHSIQNPGCFPTILQAMQGEFTRLPTCNFLICSIPIIRHVSAFPEELGPASAPALEGAPPLIGPSSSSSMKSSSAQPSSLPRSSWLEQPS